MCSQSAGFGGQANGSTNWLNRESGTADLGWLGGSLIGSRYSATLNFTVISQLTESPCLAAPAGGSGSSGLPVTAATLGGYLKVISVCHQGFRVDGRRIP